jgi:membrane protein
MILTQRRPGQGGPEDFRIVSAAAGPIGLAKRVWREILDDDVPGEAAKLAYFAFMALPPAMMALFGVAGMFGSRRLADWIEQHARVALPQEVTETIITPFIEQVVLDKAPGPLSIGIVLAFWSASTVFSGLMGSLNRAYDLTESRTFLKKRALALGVMVLGVFLFLLAAGVLLLGRQIPGALGLGSAGQALWNLIQWPLAFAFVIAAFWLAYYLLPNRAPTGSGTTLLKAAAAGAALWLVATGAFRVYISNFGAYGEAYGFLGAFIILLLWLYVTAFFVLAGGELASEMQPRK